MAFCVLALLAVVVLSAYVLFTMYWVRSLPFSWQFNGNLRRFRYYRIFDKINSVFFIASCIVPPCLFIYNFIPLTAYTGSTTPSPINVLPREFSFCFLFNGLIIKRLFTFFFFKFCFCCSFLYFTVVGIFSNFCIECKMHICFDVFANISFYFRPTLSL